MNALRRQQLRTALLMALESAKPYAVSNDALLVGIRPHGFHDLDRDTVLAELDYLAESKLVAEAGAPLAPEIRMWKITKEGRDHLATEGLA